MAQIYPKIDEFPDPQSVIPSCFNSNIHVFISGGKKGEKHKRREVQSGCWKRDEDVFMVNSLCRLQRIESLFFSQLNEPLKTTNLLKFWRALLIDLTPPAAPQKAAFATVFFIFCSSHSCLNHSWYDGSDRCCSRFHMCLLSSLSFFLFFSDRGSPGLPLLFLHLMDG